MLIERDIEEKIKAAVANAAVDCEVVGSWQPSNVGYVKGENDRDAKATISIFVSPRSHDNFSLPTVNIDGNIVIDCRADLCPTMAEVSEIYEKVMKVFDDWHYDGQSFSDAISTDDFFATEIKLNGGKSIALDRDNGIWTVQFGFTIRGSIQH